MERMRARSRTGSSTESEDEQLFIGNSKKALAMWDKHVAEPPKLDTEFNKCLREGTKDVIATPKSTNESGEEGFSKEYKEIYEEYGNSNLSKEITFSQYLLKRRGNWLLLFL